MGFIDYIIVQKDKIIYPLVMYIQITYLYDYLSGVALYTLLFLPF
jgi:hypothetical protein